MEVSATGPRSISHWRQSTRTFGPLPRAQTVAFKSVASTLRSALAEALAELKPREQGVLCMRFGINGIAEHRLEEIGRELGVARKRIRQIQVAAQEKLGSRRLGSFIRD